MPASTGGGLGGSRRTSQASVLREQQFQRRFDLLAREVPQLLYGHDTDLYSLASGSMNDADMIQAALDAVGLIEVQGMVDEYKSQSVDKQREAYATMSPTKRTALEQAGWRIPPETNDDGWMSKVGGVKNAVLRGGGWVLGKVSKVPVINWGLRAMDWAAEEATRTQRVFPLQMSQRRLLDNTGMTSQQMLETTGIDTRNAPQSTPLAGLGNNPIVTSVVSTLGLTGAVVYPGDLWSAVKTWNSIGHEGEDDFLAEVQYEVFNNLAVDYGNEAKNILRYAKALAGGLSLEDLADSEGLTGQNAELFIAQMAGLSEQTAFKKAVTRLETGRVSFGRTFARAVYNDATRDVSSGSARYVSGGADAVFSVAADPTIVGGKITKTVRAARWMFRGAEGMEAIDRWQKLARVGKMLSEGASNAQIDEALTGINGRGWLAKVGGSRRSALLAEADAVYKPAELVAEAFRTGDFGKVRRQFPGFTRSIGDMRRFHYYRLAEDGVGMTTTDAVFDFYKFAAGDRSAMNGMINSRLLDPKSSKLFGHDGSGAFTIPHFTKARRASLFAREEFRDWLWKIDPPPAALKEAADEAAEALVMADDSVDNVAATVAPDGDTPAFDVAKARDEMEIDPYTHDYIQKRSGWVRTQLQRLADTVTTQTAQKDFLHLVDDEPLSAEIFDQFNQSIGLLGQYPKEMMDARFNRFLNGNTAQRHALVNEMIVDFANVTGITNTDAGRNWVRKYVEQANHAYGFEDELTRKFGSMDVTVRQALLEAHLENAMRIPSFKEMLIASKNLNWMRWTFGTLREGHIEAIMQKVWKPLSISKLGFIWRAGGDEALMGIGRNGLRPYFNRTVLEKYAGIRDVNGQLLRTTTGEIVRRPQGAVRPMQFFFRSMSHWFNVTDEAMQERVLKLAYQDRAFVAATPVERRAMIGAYQRQADKSLRLLPRSVRGIDQAAHRWALNASSWYHELAVSNYVSRKALAQKLLEKQSDYMARVQANRLLFLHPVAQHAEYAMTSTIMAGVQPNDVIKNVEAPIRVLKTGPGASQYQVIRTVKDFTEYKNIGHEDITGLYNNLHIWAGHFGRSPSARAAMGAHTHYVSPQSLVEITGRLCGTGLEGVKAARRRINHELMETLDQAVEWDRDALIDWLNVKKLDYSDIADVVDNWDNLSIEARSILSSPKRNTELLTTSHTEIRRRASQQAFNRIYEAEGADNLRSFVAAQVVDGKIVARPLKDGHTRINVPMIDRRAMPDLVDIIRNETRRGQFAERMRFHLEREGAGNEIKLLWDNALPLNQPLEEWLASLKASLAQGGEGYVPALMTGSSNPKVAMAMRDALHDLLGDQILPHTIGTIDVHDVLRQQPDFGVEQLSKSSFRLNPEHTLRLEPIDPENIVRQVHVLMPDGKRRWMSEEEFAKANSRPVSLPRVDTSADPRQQQMFRWTGDKLHVNYPMIDDDYVQRRFLTGQDGQFNVRYSRYEWTDGNDIEAAQLFQEFFDGLDIKYSHNLSLEDAIDWMRIGSETLGPLPIQGLLTEYGVWDDFVDLIDNATQVDEFVRRPSTFTDRAANEESKVVKAAFDDLGLDPMVLPFSRESYAEFLINRERAKQVVYGPRQTRPATKSVEAVAQEQVVLAIAMQQTESVFTRLPVDIQKTLNRIVRTTRDPAQKGDNSLQIIGEIWGNGVTEQVAVERTAQKVADNVTQFFTGRTSGDINTYLIEKTLRGNITPDDFMRLSRLDELPLEAHGPTEVLATSTRFERLLNNHFRGVVEPAIAAISRMPQFGDAFQKSLTTFRHVFDRHASQPLDDAVRALLKDTGIDIDELDDVSAFVFNTIKNQADDFEPEPGDFLSEYAVAVNKGHAGAANDALSNHFGRGIRLDQYTIDTLRKWHLNRANAYESWVEKSVEHATNMVSPFVDDHTIRSALQEYLGPVFLPFFYAEEMFLRRWARGLYETPHMLRKGQLMMNGMRNIGMIRKDEESGQEHFVILGSEPFMDVIGDFAARITGNDALRLISQPLEMRTDFMLPGWSTDQSRMQPGPAVAVVLDEMFTRFPAMQWNKEAPDRKKWEMLVPAPLAAPLRLMFRDRTEMASNQMNALALMAATGHAPEPDADAVEIEKFLEDSRQVALTIGLVKVITGQVGLTTATPRQPAELMRSEFNELISNGLTYYDALAVFLERHGPQAFVYTVFGTQNEVGAPIPSTEGAWEFMQANEEEFRNNPEAMAWLLPQQETDDVFDRRAYNESIALGLRSKRSPDELWKAMQIKQASGEYFAMRDDYEAQRKVISEDRRAGWQEKLKMLDMAWEAQRKIYLRQHPVFAESFGPDASERRQRVIDQLPLLMTAYPDNPQVKAIKPLVDAFQSFQLEYKTIEGSSIAARKMREQLFDDFFTEQWVYIKSNPRASVFFDSVIRPELPDSMEDLKLRDLGGKTMAELTARRVPTFTNTGGA